jgi:hypothetical protein
VSYRTGHLRLRTFPVPGGPYNSKCGRFSLSISFVRIDIMSSCATKSSNLWKMVANITIEMDRRERGRRNSGTWTWSAEARKMCVNATVEIHLLGRYFSTHGSCNSSLRAGVFFSFVAVLVVLLELILAAEFSSTSMALSSFKFDMSMCC